MDNVNGALLDRVQTINTRVRDKARRERRLDYFTACRGWVGDNGAPYFQQL